LITKNTQTTPCYPFLISLRLRPQKQEAKSSQTEDNLSLQGYFT